MHGYYKCTLCSTSEFLSMILTRFIINIANYHNLFANLIRRYRGKNDLGIMHSTDAKA